MNTTLSCSRSEPRCVGIKASYCAWGPVKALDWWSALYCGILLPHHSSQLLSSLVPPPSFLGDARAGNGRCISTSSPRSAMAYVKAGAREEGEVMEVVDSLRTNSREIC